MPTNLSTNEIKALNDLLLPAQNNQEHTPAFLKDALQQGLDLLKSLQQEIEIEPLIAGWTHFIDQIILLAARQFEWPNDSTPVSLIAVGGYGRQTLHPHSDIDLLILLNEPPNETLIATIEAFVTLLWDIKLKIGHSVRTLADSVTAAEQDITIATNLVETRPLMDPTNLLAKLQTSIGPEYIWSAVEFYQAKLKEQKTRHKKHGNTEYNLEPDIKNAPGGMRDLQMIGWITKRYFQTSDLQDLVRKDFLTEPELELLQESRRFLWRVRFALHLIAGRDENRLLFNYQQELAVQLGYRDSDINLAVEKFMKAYYRCAMEVSALNELLLQHFNEAILQNSHTQQIIPINSRFQDSNGYIEVCDPEVFQKYPSALLEIFVILAQRPDLEGIRAGTKRLLRNNCNLVSDSFRENVGNTKLFIELLKSPHRLSTQLKRMSRCGILGRYIPEYSDIIGQMQYDLFHIYTVDAHTLMVIANMRRFQYPEQKELYPLAATLIKRLPKIELLYLAGLFHDIGKGRGGDHSELGSTIAESFCLHHKLSVWDSKLVAWLVENHLLMSLTAQKKDLSDPEVIHEFALAVGDEVHLNYLYTLTVADINATNPTLWNHWRASLMRELYNETKRALRRGLENPMNKPEWIEDTKQKALEILALDSDKLAQTQTIWGEMHDEYFLKESAADIAWHTEAILNLPQDNMGEPLILIKESGNEDYPGATQIFIYTEDKPNLFAKTVVALDYLGLTIQDARIMTSNSNFSLDTYIVLDHSLNQIELNEIHCNDIIVHLTTILACDDVNQYNTHRLIPRALKCFTVPTEVYISNQPDRSHTVIETRTFDRPGLMAKVGQVFHEFNLSVIKAKIATFGEKAEDVFFVTEQDGNPITDPSRCEQIRERLKASLEQQEPTPQTEVSI